MLDVEAGVSVNSLWTASLFSKREPWKLSAERVVCQEDLASGPEGSVTQERILGLAGIPRVCSGLELYQENIY